MAALDVTDATFEAEVLGAVVPVIVDFWAPWCRPCRTIEPVLAELAAEHEGRARLVRVDADVNYATASRYGVLTLPTVILFADGEPVATIHGAHPKRRFVEAFGEWLRT